MSDAPEDQVVAGVDAPCIDVADSAGLAAACARCVESGVVALDTEFERTDTFYPRPALLQMYCGDDVWLVDPLTVDDTGPLRSMLEDSAVVKVMHSVSEDMEVLRHWCGAAPQGVFDTQLAAAFLGERFGIGYRDLVHGTLGVELDKGATRSNWLQRPLSAVQRRYAALDVLHLLEVWRHQEQALQATGRAAWHAEETASRVREGLWQVAVPDAWRQVRGAGGLGAEQVAVLQALAAWRESTARERDRPRGWIVKDEHLLTLAQLMPAQVEALPAELPQAVRRRWGTALVAAVAQGRALAPEARPQPPRARLSREEGEVLKKLRQLAREQARELGVADELLARRKLIEQLFEFEVEIPEALGGWRWPLVGERLVLLRDRLLQRPAAAGAPPA